LFEAMMLKFQEDTARFPVPDADSGAPMDKPVTQAVQPRGPVPSRSAGGECGAAFGSGRRGSRARLRFPRRRAFNDHRSD